MGKPCKYLENLAPISLLDTDNYEKPWLKYCDENFERFSYDEGSIYDRFCDCAKKFSSYPAMEYFGTEYSYSHVLSAVNKVAFALEKADVKENECVTICMPNTPEAIFLVYAINKVGAVCNVLHPLSSTEEIENAMRITESTLIFVTDVSYKNVKNISDIQIVVTEVSQSFPLPLKIGYNLKEKKSMDYLPSTITWKSFLKGASEISRKANRGKNDPAVIIYSGGTTGKSKGIVLSNLCFNALAVQCYAVCREARPGNSILSALPIFHGFGLCVSVHVPITLGLKCIILPKIDVKKLNETVKKKKPNLLPAIPTMLKAMTNNKSAGENSLSSVKVILSGGDYLSDDVRDTVLSYFKSCGSDAHIQIGYGLSEATAFFTATTDAIKETDNIGIPNPHTLVKICNPDTNEELPDGEIGEICVNGPSVMLGYINEPEETKNAIRSHSDGTMWLHTGDLGFMRDGILHFTSRLKRMIISNGYNIYPTELENIINKCKYVASSVVVGIKDKVRQEAPKAVIVLKKGVEKTADVDDEIRDFIKKHIAKNAQPTEIEFTDALPTTKIGKINYRKFEKKNAEDEAEPTAQITDESAERLTEIFK